MVRRGIALLTVALLGGIAGCGAGSRALHDEAMGHYEAGRYDEAYQSASDLAQRSGGGRKLEAHYVAGMSAYRLGRPAEAMRHLNVVVEHGAPDVAAPAHATLGLIHARRAEDQRAIGHFRQAADRLEGEDAARAYYHMARSEQRLGRWASARTHLSLALSGTEDADFRQAVRRQLDATGFTLQLGAFSRRENAERQAGSLAARTRAIGLGEPRVVSGGGSGQAVYRVQVGRFSTYQSALQARERLGRTDVIVTLASS